MFAGKPVLYSDDGSCASSSSDISSTISESASMSIHSRVLLQAYKTLKGELGSLKGSKDIDYGRTLKYKLNIKYGIVTYQNEQALLLQVTQSHRLVGVMRETIKCVRQHVLTDKAVATSYSDEALIAYVRAQLVFESLKDILKKTGFSHYKIKLFK